METVLHIAGVLAVGIALGLGLTGLHWRAAGRGKRNKSRKQTAATEQEKKKPETQPFSTY